jgi:SAM-dependent methyltransferase
MQRSPQSYRRPAWRLPPGVAPGTWEYTQRESIANDYSEFLKSTPLIEIDLEVTRAALPMASNQRGTRVIDFGCGDGRALEMLWQHGYDVLGIDMSQPMLACTSKRPHGDELARRLLRANLVQLEGLADQIADHAICLFSTIGMIRGRVHRRSFMKHVARLVKPGGRFVLHVHNRNDAWRDRASTIAFLRSAWQSIRRRECEWGDRTYAYRGLADMFLHTYSLRELKADFKATGWQHLKIMSLSPRSDSMLPRPKLLPSLRAGGFIAIGERSPSQPHA